MCPSLRRLVASNNNQERCRYVRDVFVLKRKFFTTRLVQLELGGPFPFRIVPPRVYITSTTAPLIKKLHERNTTARYGNINANGRDRDEVATVYDSIAIHQLHAIIATTLTRDNVPLMRRNILTNCVLSAVIPANFYFICSHLHIRTGD